MNKNDEKIKDNLDQNSDLEILDDENYNDDIEDLISSDKELSNKEKIYSYDIRLQEIDAILENYEDVLYNTGEETLPIEELNNLKKEYKEIRSKRKILIKEGKKSIWDNMPIWMGFYAIFQFIFSFFFILISISSQFASWGYQTLVLKKIISSEETWLLYVLYFFIPFISLLISFIILLILKDKRNKKLFGFIYIIQGLETIISVILMITYVTK